MTKEYKRERAFLLRKRWVVAFVICLCIAAIVLIAILLMRPHLKSYVDAWYV